MLDFLSYSDYWFSKFIIQRGLGAVYLIGFSVALNQFRPLLGERGLLPVKEFLNKNNFWNAPSIFHWHYSDRFFAVIAWMGILLSLLALAGITDSGPFWLSMLSWFLLWVLYLSIVNVGQTFYGFGWESMTLEAGFYAIFLGPLSTYPPAPVIWMLCWMLFRVEFGAGLIKMRGDSCWKKLTCMFYHHETQPLPNPISRFVHKLPKTLHKTETLGNHFIQLIAVWGLFLPQPVATISALLIIFSQSYLIITGNYAWLNWLTLLLGFSGIHDTFFTHILPVVPPDTIRNLPHLEFLAIPLIPFILYLSLDPIQNMLSSRQMMNFSFNKWHLVNSYGAFGSVTKKRYEIVIEGTKDEELSSNTEWETYEFKGKPGNPTRISPQIAPYHLRLDWQMWFAALSPRYARPWFFKFMYRLLQNDPQTTNLLKNNPFEGTEGPSFIRAKLYRYRFSTFDEKKETGQWWIRTFEREYLTAISQDQLEQRI